MLGSWLGAALSIALLGLWSAWSHGHGAGGGLAIVRDQAGSVCC
jgi:hypothetical protein